jgi:hypothetical protein
MAGSSALRAMKAEANRHVRARKNVKLAAISKVLTLTFPDNAKKTTLRWSLAVKDVPAPVAAYPHRQTRRGVSVQVNVGSRSLIPSAFVATMKSGHRGVFMRYGQASRAPTQRYKGNSRYAGQKRQPIREVFSSRIIDVFDDEGFLPALTTKARDEYVRTFERVLPLNTGRGR